MNKEQASPRAFVRPAAAVLARSYLGIIFSFVLWSMAPVLFQWTPTVVLSGSMEPAVMAGDVVVARPVTSVEVTNGTVKPGQVLLAEDPQRPGTQYTHRVVAVLSDGIVTRGDANAAPDPVHLSASAVKGIEVIRVPYAGYPIEQVREGNILPAAAIIGLAVLAQLVVLADRRAGRATSEPPAPPATRREARLARERNRSAPAKAAAAMTAAMLVVASTVLGASTATFAGSTANVSDAYSAADTFPVPAISAKPFRFGVGEPFGSIADLNLVSREVGEYPSYSQVYRDFTNTFDMTNLNATLAKGVTPIVTWEPWDAGVGGVNQPAYSLSTFPSGAHDAYLNSVADQLIADGNPPIYIRFAHEMNGNWYPWGTGVNGNAAGDYVNAWKHVVDLFNAKGVTGVTWVWAPNTAYGGPNEISGLYPGAAYVGLAGIDGFNWGDLQAPYTWAHPWDVFGTGLDALQTVAAGKNILVSEIASKESEGSDTKAQWIKDAVYYLNHWGDSRAIKIEGFVWFDFNKETNWRIDSTTDSYMAMRDALNRY